ncbi:unnamed protein product, partial [Arctogadus glacialis]
MEPQGGAESPEPNKDIQRLLRSSSSGDLSKELFHHPFGDEEAGGLSGHTASLLHVKERRQPLSSVSSLEVHFDLLDLTELTDMSDQELAEVFPDSDDENHNDSPAAMFSRSLPIPRSTGVSDNHGSSQLVWRNKPEKNSWKENLANHSPYMVAASMLVFVNDL